jgi:HlyD family secretion protein
MLLLAGLVVGGYAKRDRLAGLIDPAAQAVEVKLIKLANRAEPTVPPVLTATGKIVSDHKVQVTTKVSGQITALFFEQGDRVEKGQSLATIEDVIYRARRDEVAARLAKARAALDFQRYNYGRIAGLREQKTAAEVEYVEAQRAIREAEAQVQAEAAALEYVQKMLNDCQVLAPITGVILERNVEVGDFVAAEGGRGANANAQFALIADMAALRVEVDVSELDINRIQPDMPCTIAPEAYKDRKYDGQVMWIDPGANYSKATVQVKVRINNPDDRLRVEGSAQVVFLTEPPASAPATASATGLWIPLSACRLDSAGKTASVFILAGGRLQARTITVGRQQAGQVEVLGGLHAGQSIVREDLDKLADGQRARS